MIDALNDEVEDGDLTIEEAQEQVKIAVLGEMDEDGSRPINKKIDLGEHGYIFILADDGEQIAHPQLEGDNSWDSVDPNGVKSTQQLIKTSKDRKSTRLNSSHVAISYAVFCLKKKIKTKHTKEEKIRRKPA